MIEKHTEKISIIARATSNEPKIIQKGLREWRNKKNGYYILEVHYSSDPEKDNEEFRKQAKEGITKAKYLQEYELDWTSLDGKPIYPEYDSDIHRRELKYDPKLPLIETWDPGAWSCCMFAQLTDYGQLRILDVDMNMCEVKFEPHVKKVITKRNVLFQDARQNILISDIAAKKNQELVEYTCEDILEKHYGQKPIMNSLSHHKEDCMNLVGASFLEWVYNPSTEKNEPKVVINKTCEQLHITLKSGYRYKKQKDPAAPKTMAIDEQHPFEDIADCLHYLEYWAFMKAGTAEQRREKKEFFKRAKARGENF